MRILRFLIAALFLISSKVDAATVTQSTIWANGDTVTAAKLNNNWNALGTALNGGLDNTNANTSGGFHFFETLASLPSAGNQGRVVFNTSNNTFNIDNGSSWQTTVTPSGTPSTGYLPYYNSGWTLLSPGSQYYSLVSNGASSLPSYQQINLANGVTSTLPLANGGTGQNLSTNHQGDIYYDGGTNGFTRLTPGTSGQILKTQGASANPTWSAGIGNTLISNTSVSAAANTTDISITNTKYYMVVVSLNSASGTDEISVRLNNDTGSHYGYVVRGFDVGANANNAAVAVNSATSINISKSALFSSAKTFNAVFYILPQDANNISYVKGTSWGSTSSGGNYGYWDYFGLWSNGAANTSFRLQSVSGATFSGNVLLYEMVQSQ